MGERSFAEGGSAWSSTAEVEGFDGVHLRLEPRDGRLVVTGLYIHAPQITARMLRAVELQRLAALMAYQRPWLDSEPSEQRKQADSEITLRELEHRADKAKIFEPKGKPWPLDLLLPDLMALRARDRKAFYEVIGDMYLGRAAHTASPVKDIAEGLGVPTSRVARWVREARLIGTLPRARQGARG